jgi:hypothetical protein
MLDRKVIFKGLSTTAFFLGLPYADFSDGKGEGRRGVMSGVLGVACKSRLLMSSARSFVAASRIESTLIKQV